MKTNSQIREELCRHCNHFLAEYYSMEHSLKDLDFSVKLSLCPSVMRRCNENYRRSPELMVDYCDVLGNILGIRTDQAMFGESEPNLTRKYNRCKWPVQKEAIKILIERKHSSVKTF